MATLTSTANAPLWVSHSTSVMVYARTRSSSKKGLIDHPGHGAHGYPEAREGVDHLLRIRPSSAARGVPPPDGQVTDHERQRAKKEDAHRPERIASYDRRSEIGKRPPLPVQDIREERQAYDLVGD